MNWRLRHMHYARLKATMSRLPLVGLVCAAALLTGLALALARTTEHAKPNGEDRQAKSTRVDSGRLDYRHQEGTKIIDRLGHFRMTDGRVAFFTKDGTGPFVGLENLNLERVARTITDDPRQLTWRVTGTISKFFGQDFVRIERADLKVSAQR